MADRKSPSPRPPTPTLQIADRKSPNAQVAGRKSPNARLSPTQHVGTAAKGHVSPTDPLKVPTPPAVVTPGSKPTHRIKTTQRSPDPENAPAAGVVSAACGPGASAGGAPGPNTPTRHGPSPNSMVPRPPSAGKPSAGRAKTAEKGPRRVAHRGSASPDGDPQRGHSRDASFDGGAAAVGVPSAAVERRESAEMRDSATQTVCDAGTQTGTPWLDDQIQMQGELAMAMGSALEYIMERGVSSPATPAPVPPTAEARSSSATRPRRGNLGPASREDPGSDSESSNDEVSSLSLSEDGPKFSAISSSMADRLALAPEPIARVLRDSERSTPHVCTGEELLRCDSDHSNATTRFANSHSAAASDPGAPGVRRPYENGEMLSDFRELLSPILSKARRDRAEITPRWDAQRTRTPVERPHRIPPHPPGDHSARGGARELRRRRRR